MATQISVGSQHSFIHLFTRSFLFIRSVYRQPAKEGEYSEPSFRSRMRSSHVVLINIPFLALPFTEVKIIAPYAYVATMAENYSNANQQCQESACKSVSSQEIDMQVSQFSACVSDSNAGSRHACQSLMPEWTYKAVSSAGVDVQISQ
ncbi:hypothetical protein CHS0354_031340 [Potamilus streckersoni]|uniref:Uncharacterized protein n=1 Tax=Potamilus streckersoni TaxID=2493646 RepID=A0AAE0TDR4_9BIVA|nr:hypothetical protein CHS0354_031340 [Potamilus streckersoni]